MSNNEPNRDFLQWVETTKSTLKERWETVLQWESSGLKGDILYPPVVPNVETTSAPIENFQIILTESQNQTSEKDFIFAREIKTVDALIRSTELNESSVSHLEASGEMTKLDENFWRETRGQVFSGFDPYAWNALEGKFNDHLNDIWPLIKNESALYLKNKFVPLKLSSWPYAMSGASAPEELAILLSSALDVIKQLLMSGVANQEVARLVSFELSVSTDHFIEIAKIKSFRSLLKKLLSSLNISDEGINVFCRADLKCFSARDPWNNILRQTLMSFSALLSGANGLRLYPFDVFSKEPPSFSSRITRNVSLILIKESNLLKGFAATKGCGYLESLQEQICRKSWQIFQEIEGKGGYVGCMKSGWLQEMISSHPQHPHLVGINEYILRGNDLKFCTPLKSSQRLKLQSVLPQVNYEKQWLDIKPLKPISYSEVFEEEQLKSDEVFFQTGAPKLVYLLQEGDRVSQRQRWNWFKNYFEKRAVTVKPLTTNDEMPSGLKEIYVLGDDPQSSHVQDWLNKNSSSTVNAYWVGKLANVQDTLFKSDFYQDKADGL